MQIDRDSIPSSLGSQTSETTTFPTKVLRSKRRSFICIFQVIESLLAIPKLMSGLGTNVKNCPNYEMNQITEKTTSRLVSMQSLKTFT